MNVGEVVIWNAQTSQRLAAVVTAVNEDGTLNLRVRSDTAEEIWSGEGSGGEWEHLHRNVPKGSANAQRDGVESWQPLDEVQLNIGTNGDGSPVDPADYRLKKTLEALSE